MSEPNLKPCPFCGANVKFRKALWPSDGCVDGIIHANETDCGLIEFSNYTTDESIIELWNQRMATPVNRLGTVSAEQNATNAGEREQKSEENQ